MSRLDASRESDSSLLYRSAVLLAAGTVAFVGFAACAGMLNRRRSTGIPGYALTEATRQLKLLFRS